MGRFEASRSLTLRRNMETAAGSGPGSGTAVVTRGAEGAYYCERPQTMDDGRWCEHAWPVQLAGGYRSARG